MLLKSVLTSALLALSLGSDLATASKHGRFAEIARAPQEKAKRVVEARSQKSHKSDKDYRFLSKNTKKYLVDSLPDVPFDIGEMYSGLVPIDMDNKTRSLFFIFQPTINAPVDEVTIWLNGGPGCSSMESFLQETGRFIWQPGTFAPVENPYAWVDLTNVLWVDQPIGTGYSVGTPTAISQEETAQDFVKFFKNFQTIFGIKNFKIYVTGESYAGRYVPYISAAMLDEKDKEYFDLDGALAYDPCIGQFDTVQEELPVVPFVHANANLFSFNESFMAELDKKHKSCGYEEFIDKYLTFPPPGVQPPLLGSTLPDECDRVLIANGDLDMVILTNGTLLAIQNMTWNGNLGFQNKPNKPIDIKIPDLMYAKVFAENGETGIDGPQGVMGVQHYERGLMWAQSFQSGHMQPQYQPRVAFRHLEWLLRRTEEL